MSDKSTEIRWRPSLDLQSTIAPSTTGSRSESGRSLSSATTAPQVLPSPRTPGSGFSNPLDPIEDDDDGDLTKIHRLKGGAVQGWPKAAEEMTERPQFRSFSRFQLLNMKNLLYYQVELARLQERLVELEEDYWGKYQKAKTERKVRERERYNIAMFADKMVPEDDDDGDVSLEPGKDHDNDPKPGEKQWKLIKRIRNTLKEYNAAILQYLEISKLPTPRPDSVEAFRRWLGHEKHGNLHVGGAGSQAWGDPRQEFEIKPTSELLKNLVKSIFGMKEEESTYHQDLISMLPPDNCDPCSRWISTEAIPTYFKLRETRNSDASKSSTDPENPKKKIDRPREVQKVEGRRILRVTSVLATMASCVLPILGIGALAAIRSMRNRIILIGVFSILISGGLLFLTKSTRVEVFTATAAFSAVLVVFVQK